MKERLHILIVEDDLFIQSILSQSLSADYSLTTAGDGLEAMSLLQQGQMPDAIITDLHVPGLDGLQLVEQIRSSGFFNTIPVIMLSGEQSTEKKIECLEAGADDYVEKPFNPREIRARLNTILKRTGKVVNS